MYGSTNFVLPTAVGARICYQLDRESAAYQAIYNQRTAVERLFSQAVARGAVFQQYAISNSLPDHTSNSTGVILLESRPSLDDEFLHHYFPSFPIILSHVVP